MYTYNYDCLFILFMGFSRQEYWSGLPFPSPAADAKSLQSCPTLCDPIDVSPPGSPAPGILQARTLEWVAISFSDAWKWKSESEVAQSCPTLSDPMDCSPPGSSIHGIFQARLLEWGAIAFSIPLSTQNNKHLYHPFLLIDIFIQLSVHLIWDVNGIILIYLRELTLRKVKCLAQGGNLLYMSSHWYKKNQKQKSIDSPVEHVQISKILNSEEEHLKIPHSWF